MKTPWKKPTLTELDLSHITMTGNDPNNDDQENFNNNDDCAGAGSTACS